MENKLNPKKIGNAFQQDFEKSIPINILCERYKDSPGRFKNVANPADFWVNDGRYVLLVECKSTQDNRFSVGMVRMTQLWKMLKRVIKHRTYGGYLVNFRTIGETYFLFVEDFVFWYLTLCVFKSGSIPLDYIRDRGYLVSSKVKITRSRYDIQSLLDWIYETKLKEE